jgi:hypothetical protein
VTEKLLSDLERVETREDLSCFVTELAQDLKENKADWENQDLPSFLEAVSAWIEDMDGFYKNKGEEIPESVSWKAFANILYAAKRYE